MAKIFINYGTDADKMVYHLLQKAGVDRELKRNMRVVLKPNLVVSRPASDGATTHPEIAEGIIRFLQDFGISDITIAEGAWVGDSTKSGFQRCGYRELEQRYGVKLFDTKGDKAQKRTAQGYEVNICNIALEADYLINLPVLKGHCQTDMTCCLKNLKGCIPDSEKRRFHATGLHKPIAVLADILRPDLHVIDSICGDLTFEEGGNPVESNRIILGHDPVILDSYGAQLLGYRPEEIEHLRLAREFGVGNFCDEATEIIELNKEKKPAAEAPRSRIAKSLARYVEEDSACSACYAALIFALDKAGASRLGDREIKIGQGFRGKKVDGIGVGSCTSGCRRYIEGCPPKAVDIVDFLKIG